MIFIHLAPVSFDAKPSAGGYKRWVSDKHSKEIAEKYLLKEGCDSKSYTILSAPEEITSSVNWEGRNIYLVMLIEVNGEKKELSVEGKRYWIEKFNWKIEV